MLPTCVVASLCSRVLVQLYVAVKGAKETAFFQTGANGENQNTSFDVPLRSESDYMPH